MHAMSTGLPPPAAFYDAEMLRPENSYGMLMRTVLTSIILQVDRKLAAHDLTHAQWVPLYKLAHGECATMAELSRALQTDAGSMTRALDRLEAKGLVQRVRSTSDRRVVNLELTEAGRQISKEVPGVLSEVLNAHLAGFDEAEWHTLLDLLRRLRANGDLLRQAAGDTTPARNP